MKTVYTKLAIASALLAIGTAAGVANADDSGRWYLGAGIGQSKAANLNNIDGTLANYGLGSASTVSGNNTAWKLYLGYQVNSYFGVEGAYTNLGQSGITSAIATPVAGTGNGTWTANNIYSLSAVGTLPIQDGLSAFGKIGAAYSNINFTYSGGGAAVSANNSAVSPLYGVGLKYDITGNTSVRGEFERYQNLGDSALTGQSSVNVLSLDLQYRF
jgi:OmpA-OmpF porin, OOP family